MMNWLHFYSPKIETNGELSLKLRRMIDHCLVPPLSIYLLDHERDRNTLFEKLKRKTYNLYLVVHKADHRLWSIVDDRIRSFIWKWTIHGPDWMDPTRTRDPWFHSIHIIFSEYVSRTSQKTLRHFTDCRWESASQAVKNRIVAKYSLSPKALMDHERFSFREFQLRLKKECSKTFDRWAFTLNAYLRK